MARIVCVFAHPDDEVLGPGGTIATLSAQNEVYVICVTRGNQKGRPRNLGEIRKKEMSASCKILGVKELIFLGYDDGSLNNNLYHELADRLRVLLNKIKPETIITFELRGVTGHLDHVAVSLATTFVAEKLIFVKRILYYCLDEAFRSLFPEYFIYVPPGYTKKEINRVFDVSQVWETRIRAMKCHKSQIQDVNRLLEMFKVLPKKEYFLEVKKIDLL